MRYRNVSNETRVWPTLQDSATGRTLTLPPGGETEIDGFVIDPYLRVVEPDPEPEPTPAKPIKTKEI